MAGTWDLWTRIAIGILELGSVAVFAWFLVDVVRLARRRGAGRREDEPAP